MRRMDWEKMAQRMYEGRASEKEARRAFRMVLKTNRPKWAGAAQIEVYEYRFVRWVMNGPPPHRRLSRRNFTEVNKALDALGFRMLSTR